MRHSHPNLVTSEGLTTSYNDTGALKSNKEKTVLAAGTGWVFCFSWVFFYIVALCLFATLVIFNILSRIRALAEVILTRNSCLEVFSTTLSKKGKPKTGLHIYIAHYAHI